jgi:hypothetical protein
MVKRCLFCGRYFTPDHRVKNRQKSCRRPECRKARQKTAQAGWVNKNPGYFAGLYETYVKPWRRRKGMIKDKIPSGKPLQKLIILIPDETMKMIKDEIRLKRVGTRTFAPHGLIKDEMDQRRSKSVSSSPQTHEERGFHGSIPDKPGKAPL